MSHIMRRALAISAIFLLGLTLTVSAERVWVTNRDTSTVTVFDYEFDVGLGVFVPTEVPGSPVTVGAGPIDIASDSPDALGPQKMFVVNSGSDTVSHLGVDPVGGASTILGGGTYGNFDTPSGIVRVPFPNGETHMVITDQKVTPRDQFSQPATGRGTIRFMSAQTHAIVKDFRDPSPSARYNDVVFANNRLWIADDGDGGIVVVQVPGTPSSYYYPQTLTFQGSADFADFIYDDSTTKTFLIRPTKLATNGSVVVAVDSASNLVTIIDANYAFNGESGAILQNVTLPGAFPPFPAGNGLDVKIFGNFAYVSQTPGGFIPINLHRIDLTTFAIASIFVPGAQGLGVSSDGTQLFVGSNSLIPPGPITIFDITPAPGFPTGGLPGASFPGTFHSAFYVSPRASISGPPPGGGGDPWVSTGGLAPGEGGSSKSNCGLMGLEALLALLALRLARGRRA